MPSFSLKPGVTLDGLQLPMLWAIPVLANIYFQMDKHAVITSGLDGTHSHNSLHYSGNALDWRTRHLESKQKTDLARQAQDLLGPDYDVVLESTHLHVEYDPK